MKHPQTGARHQSIGASQYFDSSELSRTPGAMKLHIGAAKHKPEETHCSARESGVGTAQAIALPAPPHPGPEAGQMGLNIPGISARVRRVRYVTGGSRTRRKRFTGGQAAHLQPALSLIWTRPGLR